jgi:hypothetical protein
MLDEQGQGVLTATLHGRRGWQGMEGRIEFAAALVGAAIGGIVATLVTGDALALVAGLVAGPCVFLLVGAVLNPEWPPNAATYAFILVGTMASGVAALSYIFFGIWVAVVAVLLMVVVVVVGTLYWLYDNG